MGPKTWDKCQSWMQTQNTLKISVISSNFVKNLIIPAQPFEMKKNNQLWPPLKWCQKGGATIRIEIYDVEISDPQKTGQPIEMKKNDQL